MAIRFTDKPSERAPRKPSASKEANGSAQAEGEARFATPIEATTPTNPDASGRLPFADLPPAEAAVRRKRPAKSAKPG